MIIRRKCLKCGKWFNTVFGFRRCRRCRESVKRIICLILLSLSLLAYPSINQAYSKGICQPHPANLWKGILREAAGEGYIGMYAVCCVVRNRLAVGMHHGLVGMKRKDLEHFVLHEYGKTQQDAIKAVDNIFCHNALDITKGALYFESTDFINRQWFTGKIILVKIGKHYFYKYRRPNAKN